MRQTMKKRCWGMLAVLMLSVGMMGAVGSAQAQTASKVWERVGEFKLSSGYKGVTGSGGSAQICSMMVDQANIVTWSNSVYKYIYIDKFRLSPGGHWTLQGRQAWLSCDVQQYDSRNPNWYHTTSIGAYVTCEAGQTLFKDSSGGCYVQKETCPEGTKADEKGVCVKPEINCPEGTEPAPQTGARSGEQQCVPKCDGAKGEIWDSDAKECVDPCEGKGSFMGEDGKWKHSYGGQVCHKDNRVIIKACVWQDNIAKDYPYASDILAHCVKPHEDEHMNATDDQYCRIENDRADWKDKGLPGKGALRECDGHIIEMRCIDQKIRDNACAFVNSSIPNWSIEKCKLDLENRRKQIYQNMTGTNPMGAPVPICNILSDGTLNGVTQTHKE